MSCASSTYRRSANPILSIVLKARFMRLCLNQGCKNYFKQLSEKCVSVSLGFNVLSLKLLAIQSAVYPIILDWSLLEFLKQSDGSDNMNTIQYRAIIA